MDKVSKSIRRKTMQAVKSNNTKLEDQIASELWKRGKRFRKNVKSLYGKPDIAIKKYKIVIFIDSCFWHGCDKHLRMPSSNVEYWKSKIERNKKRDKEVNEYYLSKKWNILRIWEHNIKNNYEETIQSVINFIDKCMVIS